MNVCNNPEVKMRQTPAQRRASMRNLKKAWAATGTKKGRKTKRRKNPSLGKKVYTKTGRIMGVLRSR